LKYPSLILAPVTGLREHCLSRLPDLFFAAASKTTEEKRRPVRRDADSQTEDSIRRGHRLRLDWDEITIALSSHYTHIAADLCIGIVRNL